MRDGVCTVSANDVYTQQRDARLLAPNNAFSPLRRACNFLTKTTITLRNRTQ